MTAWAKSAFSARKPKPGWMASAPEPGRRRPRRWHRGGRRASGPSVRGTTRRCRAVARPRDPRGDLAAVGHEEASRMASRRRDSVLVACSNASNASNATRHRPPTRRAGSRPARSTLDSPRRRPEPPRDLARAQFFGHFVAIVAYDASRATSVRVAQAAPTGRRFSSNAAKPSRPRRSRAGGRSPAPCAISPIRARDHGPHGRSPSPRERLSGPTPAHRRSRHRPPHRAPPRPRRPRGRGRSAAPDGVEPTPAGEQRPCVRLTDLGDDEWRDHRRQDARGASP